MAELELRNVSKSFPGGVRAVRELSLRIADGEFVILVGPSGCGKSTILRMIAGLEEATSGEILMDGRRINGVEPQRREVAMVFQSYALYPHLTVFRNIAFPLRLRRMPREQIKKRVRDAAAVLGLEGHLDRMPRELSGGQRQRVALGRAMVREPRAFLFDEPLSNLDAKLRGEMRVEIARLHQRLGTTFVYVTHDQTEAMTLGQRIALLKDGLLQQFAPPEELFDRPANRFVAGFIGSPPMNFLHAEVKAAGDSVALVGNGLEIPLTDDRRKRVAGSGLSGVIMGIRAKDLSLREKPGWGRIRARFLLREMLGEEVLYYFRAEGSDHDAPPLIVKETFATSLEPDAPLTLFADPARLHLFNPRTEDSLTSNHRPDPN
jgi:multiple sugar transport system ATP-binding protein